jgi:hypothetical protein
MARLQSSDFAHGVVLVLSDAAWNLESGGRAVRS